MKSTLEVFYLLSGQVSVLSYPLRFTELVVVLELRCILMYKLGDIYCLFQSAPLKF